MRTKQFITRMLVLAAGLSVLLASTVPVAAQEPAKPQEAPPPATQEAAPPAAQEASPPAAQEAAPPAAQSETGTGFMDSPLRFDVNLYLWAMSIPVTIKDGNREFDINASFHDLLKYMNFGAMGKAEVHKGALGLFVSPVYGDLEESTNFTGPLGFDNNAKGTIKLWLIDYGVSYQVGRWKLSQDADGPALSVEPYGGYRYVYDKTTIKLSSGLLGTSRSTSDISRLNTPILGARAVLDLTKRWYFTAAGDYGWSVGEVNNTWQAIGLVGFKFKMGKFPSRVFAGTRYLYINADNGSANIKLTVKGPLVGLGMEF